MTTPGAQFLADVRKVTQGVDTSEVSTTKWNPLRDVVEESLNRVRGEVYVTTVSKPGNLGVRFMQSTSAVNADVVVVVYTGGLGEFDRNVNAAAERQQQRQRDLVLFFVPARGWGLEAVVKPRGTTLPLVVATANPTAVIDV